MVRGPKTPYIATQGLYTVLCRDANQVRDTLKEPRIRLGDGGVSCETVFVRLREAGRAWELTCAPREEVILFS